MFIQSQSLSTHKRTPSLSPNVIEEGPCHWQESALPVARQRTRESQLQHLAASSLSRWCNPLRSPRGPSESAESQQSHRLHTRASAHIAASRCESSGQAARLGPYTGSSRALAPATGLDRRLRKRASEVLEPRAAAVPAIAHALSQKVVSASSLYLVLCCVLHSTGPRTKALLFPDALPRQSQFCYPACLVVHNGMTCCPWLH